MRHLIPDDGGPHAPTTECGCDPYLKMVTDPVDGLIRQVVAHQEISSEFTAVLREFLDENDELLTRLARGPGGGDDGGWSEHRGTGES